ncbi:MAG TPA: sensor histidine kinase [Candidatus Methylomirabilis sp.]|nr:sensor histidine kinase [Candidatus Methylomirabilis sp.]
MLTDAFDPEFESPSSSWKIRWIVLSAFGGMLLLMIFAGADSLQSLRKLNQVSGEVSQRFSARSEALVAVVVTVHTYTDQMEEYMLSDAVTSDMAAPAEIQKHGQEVHTAVNKYPRDCGPDERSLLAKIDEGISTQEGSFAGILARRAEERKQRGHAFVYGELIPRKTQLLRLASSVADLNGKELNSENQALAAQFEQLQNRLGRTIAVTLVAGLLLSLAAGFYILRLEQHGRGRYLALARSRQELERLSRRLVDAQEAERRSISRELHDEVGQTLGALLVDVGHLSNLLPAEDKIAQEQIGRIKKAGETAVKSIRDMALLLRPPMLDDLGLIPALEWQARETSRRGEMEVEVHAEELTGDLPDDVKVGIYRLVQEALQNAATHADAKNATVVVKRERNSVVVEIIDDGKGFQPERTRGMGILGMEERVRQLRGALVLRSTPGKGTTVHAELPINDKGVG